jgi:hypothetical protein
LEEDAEQVLEKAAKSLPLKLSEANLDSMYLILAFFSKKKDSLTEAFCKSTFGVKSLVKKSSLENLAKGVLGSCLPYAAVEKHPVIRSLVTVMEKLGATAKFWVYVAQEMTGTAHKGLIAMLVLRYLELIGTSFVTPSNQYPDLN